MLKALVIKELRESAGIVALVALAFLFMRSLLLAGAGLPWQIQYGGLSGVPFVSDSFDVYLWMIVGAMAIALGMKQSAWELGQNTYLFLLHRPAGRGLLFGSKLLVGGGLMLAASGLAIVAYALWAAKPGHSPTPFFWSMTAHHWQLSLSLLLIYLASFLSGLRPARWFGTRLAPLVAAVPLTMICIYSPWWVAAIVCSLAVAVYLVAIRFYAQSRDF